MGDPVPEPCRSPDAGRCTPPGAVSSIGTAGQPPTVVRPA